MIPPEGDSLPFCGAFGAAISSHQSEPSGRPVSCIEIGGELKSCEEFCKGLSEGVTEITSFGWISEGTVPRAETTAASFTILAYVLSFRQS